MATKIATGEITEDLTVAQRSAAAELGTKGVKAHASKPKRTATYRKRGAAATISN